MGKAKKRAKNYRYNVNRKKLFKKLKKGPSIESEVLKTHWNKKTSINKNLSGMGLCADPNKMLAVPLTKHTMAPGNDEFDPYFDDIQETKAKTSVLEEFEKEAASGKKHQESMSTDEAKFVSHLLQNYASTDFKTMAKDYKNYWQNTPLQIKKKIDRFSRLYPDVYREHLTKD